MKQTQMFNTLQLIRCSIGDESYCIEMSCVQSIQRTDRILPINKPKSSLSEAHSSNTTKHHALVGWLPGNEYDIPVFSLESILEFDGQSDSKSAKPPRRGNTQRIIVLYPPPSRDQDDNENGQTSWGIIVDRISQIIQLPEDRIISLPSIVVNPTANYFLGVLILDEELVLCLSPEHLHQEVAQKSKFLIVRIDDKSPTPDIDEQLKTVSKLTYADEQLENQNTEQDIGRKRIVTFAIPESYSQDRTVTFGLSISQVPEILEPLPMIRVPAAPEYVLGLLNWRDRPVPLIDFAKRLGWSPELKTSSTNGVKRMIIVRDAAKEESTSYLPKLSQTKPISQKSLNPTTLGALLIQPTIQLMRLPIKHQPGDKSIPFDQTFTRCVVELQDETLVIPDVSEILSRHD